MTSDLFQKYLRQWDKELAKKKRKIVLLIDECTVHIEPSNLEWIQVVFLPPNTTSILQPTDQGVIRSLKCHYRKQLILRILKCYDKNKDCDISLLDAVVLLEKSWRLVTESTIRNCFSHVPDSNFSLQQVCHKFVMTRVQICHDKSASLQ
ncbi:Tigger transposable element-derived protein 4 [Araneus ventricosus]|uniref:Tigger transposable element-derived protein 4 n=1 Tax=Araneus ventricosus TaxID=182803 RepID=A0A4Y2PMY6_ARAVE|nr:Tigger transposable element-derived protein 4 [Araneus ventricosus]GBN52432.1 Tigger transposable element-derived protein 4 [Araneus ventricosus]